MMIKVKRIVIAVAVINITGCRTLHSEQKYYLKHFAAITKKYGWELKSTIPETLPPNYQKPTRKQIKKFLAIAEYNTALCADSVYRSDKKILERGENGHDILKQIPGSYTCDSFYTNPAKIEYIKKHHLQSPHIHFIQKKNS